MIQTKLGWIQKPSTLICKTYKEMDVELMAIVPVGNGIIEEMPTNNIYSHR